MADASAPRNYRSGPGSVEMYAGAANDGLDPSRTVQSPRLSLHGASWGGEVDAAVSQLVRRSLGSRASLTAAHGQYGFRRSAEIPLGASTDWQRDLYEGRAAGDFHRGLAATVLRCRGMVARL
jgi:hypothetical protein